jgi:hypothetical protein
MINGAEPVVGKQVYDMNLGYGRIIAVEPDLSFVVDFGASRRQRFSTGGFVGNIRRIYWENPVVVEPMADDTSWQTFVSVARQMYQMVRTLRGL